MLQRLQDIYIVLCALHNMRSRHLRSKTPLNPDVIKSFRRFPFGADEILPPASAYGKERGTALDIARIPSHQQRTSRLDVPAPAKVNPNNSKVKPSETSWFVSTATPESGVAHALENDVLTPINTVDHIKSLVRRKNLRQKLTTTAEERTSVALETWEDLLNVGKSRLAKMIKRIPPWMKPISCGDIGDVTRKTKKASELEADNEHNATYHSEHALCRLRLACLHGNEKLRKSAMQQVVKAEREQLVKSRYNLAAFDGMQALYEVHKRGLREGTRVFTRDPELILEERAEWYDSLLQDSLSLGLDNDEDINEWLSALEMFIHEHTPTVPNVREKLCLFCLSLPAPQLGTRSMLNAIKFVLEKVLECGCSLLTSWLDLRHLSAFKAHLQ